MGRTSIYLAHENKHYVVTVKDFREKTLFIEDFDRKNEGMIFGLWFVITELNNMPIGQLDNYFRGNNFCCL